MTDSEPTYVSVFYAGRRHDSIGGGTSALFVHTDNGRPLPFAYVPKKFKNAVIGQRYAIQNSPSKKGSYLMPVGYDWWSAKLPGNNATAEKKEEWQLLDKAFVAKQQHDMLAKNPPDVERLMDKLRNVRCQLTRAQQAAFDAWILREIRK